jgi:hypothetical protein
MQMAPSPSKRRLIRALSAPREAPLIGISDRVMGVCLLNDSVHHFRVLFGAFWHVLVPARVLLVEFLV